MDFRNILTAEGGDRLFLLGNEAAVRAAIEAGVSVTSTYPGTPSSEIGDLFSKIASEANIYFEFSINEKVALEVAASAAASGVRSFVFMKHVGLNVASDSFMSIAYTGVEGGMIILSADDPSMFSSQNEQDNRHYARIANIPILEPSNPQEILDFMKYGFGLSEKFKIPVLLRTTTRVSHMRGVVEVGEKRESEEGFFRKNPSRFVLVPATAKKMHKKLIEKIDGISSIADKSPLNSLYFKGGIVNLDDLKEMDFGVIASGSAFNYVYDVIVEDNLEIPILKLGFTYPFPQGLVSSFLKIVDKVLIVEEVDPIMEREVLAIKGAQNLRLDVHGKVDATLPMIYEYNEDIVREGVNKVLGIEYRKEALRFNLPKRSPTLCPGCPHRSVYYAIREAARQEGMNLRDIIFATDIGCYTLGLESPYNAADYLLSMGSSIGTGCGFSRATDKTIISFIGDSTFFHAGIPPLINAVHNKHRFIIVILDNRTTAMTGGQPHPGLPVDGMGNPAPEISIEEIVKASGVDFVQTINPMNIRKSVKTFRKVMKDDLLAVIISRYPCMLASRGVRGKPMKIDRRLCDNCLECVSKLACPAIISDDDEVHINTFHCRGCTVCLQICPQKAIKPIK